MAAVGIEGAAIGALGAAVVLLTAHLIYTRRLRFVALPDVARPAAAPTRGA